MLFKNIPSLLLFLLLLTQFILGCKLPIPLSNDETALSQELRTKRSYTHTAFGGELYITESDEFTYPLKIQKQGRLIFFEGWKAKEFFKFYHNSHSIDIINKSPKTFKDITLNIRLANGKIIRYNNEIKRFTHYSLRPCNIEDIREVKLILQPSDQIELDRLKTLEWTVRDFSSKLPGNPDSKFTLPISSEYAKHYAAFFYNFCLLFTSPEFKEFFYSFDNMVIEADKTLSSFTVGEVLKDEQVREYRRIRGVEKAEDGYFYLPLDHYDNLQIGLFGNITSYKNLNQQTKEGFRLLQAHETYKEYINQNKYIDLRVFINSNAAGLGGGNLISVHEQVLINWITYHPGGYGSSSIFYIFYHEMGHWMGYSHKSGMTYGTDNLLNRWLLKDVKDQQGQFPQLKSIPLFPYRATDTPYKS